MVYLAGFGLHVYAPFCVCATGLTGRFNGVFVAAVAPAVTTVWGRQMGRRSVETICDLEAYLVEQIGAVSAGVSEAVTTVSLGEGPAGRGLKSVCEGQVVALTFGGCANAEPPRRSGDRRGLSSGPKREGNPTADGLHRG